jgi:hypothetical protein
VVVAVPFLLASGACSGGCEKNPRSCFITFLNSPRYKTPKNAIKKKQAKQPGEKKNGGKQIQMCFCCETPKKTR